MAAKLPRYQKQPLSLLTEPGDVATEEHAQPSNPEAPAQGSEPAKKEYPHKMSFYVDVEDAEEIRGAFKAQFSQAEGDTSMSTFIAGAVKEKVQRLRAELNAGKPFPGIEAGGAGRGRQLGG